MRRRRILAAGAAALACPWLAHSQTETFRIGWLHSSAKKSAIAHVDAFLAGMRERGYVEGRHFVLHARFADGKSARQPALARELALLRPHVLIGFETTALHLRAAAPGIPIVLTTSIDPVAAGLVKSLARPGTNVTGMVDLFEQLLGKHVELLLELAPAATEIALLVDRAWSAHRSYERYANAACAAKGIKLAVLPTASARDLSAVLDSIHVGQYKGLIVSASGGMLIASRQQVVGAVRRLRLPAVYAFPIYPDAGGLLSYGPNLMENSREAADFVVRILKGEDPANLPIRRTKKFDLVVNAKAAEAIGMTIPRSILLRADRVIE